MRTSVFLLALCASGVAQAAYSIQLDHVFSGTTPTGSSPYLTATFTGGVAATSCANNANGCVQLTLDASNLTGGEFVTEWDFNLANSVSLTNLAFYNSTGTLITNSSGTFSGVDFNNLTGGPYQADGDGKHDFGFVFPTANSSRFTGGTITFYLSGVGANITESSFTDQLGTTSANGQYESAAHIQGIGTANCSGWVGGNGILGSDAGGPTSCSPVPEPLYSGLFLTGGLIGFAFIARRRIAQARV